MRIAAVATGTALIASALLAAPATAAPPRAVDPFDPDFGPNVTIYSPDTPVADIRAELDALHAQQVDAEMSTERQAVYFLPGEYGSAADPLQVKVGYYTEIAGLGASPEDVTVHGAVEVYNRCLADGGTGNCLALVNFWRTISNLSIDIQAAGPRLPHRHRLLGRVAGGLDAAPRRLGRQPVADGLLHRRPAVRERRLHRRLATAQRDQRLAAAVAHPQQRGGRLVERRLEPGVLGRRRRPRRRGLPRPAVHDARRDAAQP